jgi:hypothetical protein
MYLDGREDVMMGGREAMFGENGGGLCEGKD